MLGPTRDKLFINAQAGRSRWIVGMERGPRVVAENEPLKMTRTEMTER